MAFDKELAQRVRAILAARPGLTEKQMFGGIGFMLHGNMCCGVLNNELIVRLGPDRDADAGDHPGTRTFDFTGRPMKGWIVVTPEGYEPDDALERWVDQGVRFALSLPLK